MYVMYVCNVMYVCMYVMYVLYVLYCMYVCMYTLYIYIHRDCVNQEDHWSTRANNSARASWHWCHGLWTVPWLPVVPGCTCCG